TTRPGDAGALADSAALERGRLASLLLLLYTTDGARGLERGYEALGRRLARPRQDELARAAQQLVDGGRLLDLARAARASDSRRLKPLLDLAPLASGAP